MHDSWSKTSSQSPLILFATPAPLEQLRAITVWVNCTQTSIQNLAKFQPQVIKCREFIFTEPEIIGSPSADMNDSCFHLIAQLSQLTSGRLQTRLTRVGLKVTDPYPVTAELYQACLRYTLQARISPVWNKAGQWLIQGRDFLTQKGVANAVKMDVTVQQQELFFTLEATALKLAPLQVTDLDLLGQTLEQYLRHPDAEIDHDSIASDWCYVLPSMKRGRIMSISHELPEDSPFMSYRDLKRHWKNTYGYRLPDTDDDMNFYQIHFGRLGGKFFTYPEVCLRSREMLRVARVDPKPILRSFMLELQSKFPTVCGFPMKLQSKAKFTITELLECGKKEQSCQPNLTSKMGTSRPAVYRSKTEMESLMTTSKTQNMPINRPISHQLSLPKSVQPMHGRSESGTCHQYPAQKQGSSCISNQTTFQFIQSGSKTIGSNHSSVQKTDTSGRCEDRFNTYQSNPNVNSSSSLSLPTAVNVSLVSSNSSAKTLVTPVTNINSTHGQNKFGARRVEEDSRTPSHTSVCNSQAAVARKLFPQFKPKKLLSTDIINPSVQQTAPKVIPLFNKHKKLDVTQNTNFANSSIDYQSATNSTVTMQQGVQNNGSALSVQRMAPSFQKKIIPVSSKAIGPGSKKSGGSSGKVGKQNSKAPKGEKVKRSKEAKKETGEPKKKKMKKAEA